MTSSDPLRVLLVAAEAIPFAKAGGLGDMVGSLAAALRTRGIDARILLPRYGWIPRRQHTVHARPLTVKLGSIARDCAVVEARGALVPTYFLEHDVLYNREFIYGPPGSSYDDNCLRFAILSRGAIDFCHWLDFKPHVLHLHDWQSAFAAALLNVGDHSLGTTASVLTIHNLAYQGTFSWSKAHETGLHQQRLVQLGFAHQQGFSLLRGGIQHATVLTTVSPSYAREIQTPRYGESLDEILRHRAQDLFGVQNGIDRHQWDPLSDTHIAKNYSVDDLAGKAACKTALQHAAGLPSRADVPLLGMVSRFTKQKGLDLLIKSLDRILDLDTQVVVLGRGDRSAEDFFQSLARRRPDRFKAWITFDEAIAHHIEAGADFFLMPSLWEPSGLNQMYSQIYGTLPIVHHTGGLIDTVTPIDETTGIGTGFVFRDATSDALLDVVKQAVSLYRRNPSLIREMIRKAMSIPYSWEKPAAMYEYYYRLASVRRSSR